MANQFNILDYTDGPLLKTGQVVDQTPAGRTTKDDGGFQRGIAGSKADNQYTILTTGQYSGTTNITVNGFTDAHTNECVFDKVTSLMWNRELSDSIYGIGNENLEWNDAADVNEDIFEYCDQANLSNLSGFLNWRVPNIVEMYSLFLSNGVTLPAINSTAFPVFTTSNVWTSTTSNFSNANAYSLGFLLGLIASTPKVNATRYPILLVRLGVET